MISCSCSIAENTSKSGRCCWCTNARRWRFCFRNERHECIHGKIWGRVHPTSGLLLTWCVFLVHVCCFFGLIMTICRNNSPYGNIFGQGYAWRTWLHRTKNFPGWILFCWRSVHNRYNGGTYTCSWYWRQKNWIVKKPKRRREKMANDWSNSGCVPNSYWIRGSPYSWSLVYWQHYSHMVFGHQFLERCWDWDLYHE